MSWERPSEDLLQLLEENLQGVECEKKKMFGQYAFFMNGNMFCGVHQSKLFLRMAQDDLKEAMSRLPDLRKFEPREGMAMKEYVQASSEFVEDLERFRGLLRKSIEYARGLPPKK
ncbi:MAG: TfoX/Sxy family protein [Candidatus Thorarchaeota archaeon]|nr:MAG: TfoX/Sxy family protein [Candidatus Thorarchaeota archaeon]